MSLVLPNAHPSTSGTQAAKGNAIALPSKAAATTAMTGVTETSGDQSASGAAGAEGKGKGIAGTGGAGTAAAAAADATAIIPGVHGIVPTLQ